MSRKSKLQTFADQIGFRIHRSEDSMALENIPCLLANSEFGFCTIEKSFDPESGKLTEALGGALHGVRVKITSGAGAQVFQANGDPLGNLITSDQMKWSDISIKCGSADSPVDDSSVEHLLHRYAKQIIGAREQKRSQNGGFSIHKNPFKIPNTFESRSGLMPMHDQIRNQRIVIIGLGGTGSYLLDLISKTPVAEIHCFDDDAVNWHNFMRAPGAPNENEIERVRRNELSKANYYEAKYSPLREDIIFHSIRVTDRTKFAEFLSSHQIDFAFVTIDQRIDSECPRRDEVYEALSEMKIPFIDSGISIALESDQIHGSVTTSLYENGSQVWQRSIPNARVLGNAPGYRNVQVPEANALAASLATMEWRRYTGQYASKSKAFLHKFRLESAKVLWPLENSEEL